jgi:hypothetical protein
VSRTIVLRPSRYLLWAVSAVDVAPTLVQCREVRFSLTNIAFGDEDTALNFQFQKPNPA